MPPEHKRISNDDLPDLKRMAYGINNTPSRFLNTSLKSLPSASNNNNNNINSSNNLNQDGCFESLIPSFRKMNNSFITMKDQYNQLQEIDKSLSKFNDSFGAFLLGMSVNGMAVDWLKAPDREIIEKYKKQLNKDDDNQPSTSKSEEPNHKNKQKSVHTNTKEPNSPVVNKKSKFATKVNIQKIIDHLPLKYREQTEHMKNMQIILKILRSNPDGMNMATMVKISNLPKYRVTDCLNALVHSKHVVKHNPQGQLANYKLDPVRYPSS